MSAEGWSRFLGGRAGIILAGAVCVMAAIAGRGSLAGAVADLDAFYHMGHATRYADASVFDTAFPWARFSAIGAHGADLWWGYHMLLQPFAGVTSLTTAIHWASVAGTATLLLVLLGVLRRHRVGLPLFWVLLAFAGVPNVLYRHLMMRPHVLSLAGTVLLASFLAGKRWRAAAAAAFALSWVHASLFWEGLLILGAFGVAVAVERAGLERLRPAALHVLAGLGLGLLLRPHPLATLKLVDVQLLELLRRRGEGIDLTLGGELLPLPAEALFPVAWLVLIPWSAAVAWIAWRGFRPTRGEIPEEDLTLLRTSALMSVAFLAIALTLANRALVEWCVFAVLATALAWQHLVPGVGLRRLGAALLTATAIAASPWIAGWHALNVRLNAYPPSHLEEAATWLAAQGDDGDMVAHVHWDQFGPLFARDPRHHYVGGMDPVFQLAHDPELYRRTLGLTGSDPLREDAWDVLAGGYAADWVLIEPRRDPSLYEALRIDPRFDAVRVTRGAVVFRVVP